jgi:hypothetical protein
MIYHAVPILITLGMLKYLGTKCTIGMEHIHIVPNSCMKADQMPDPAATHWKKGIVHQTIFLVYTNDRVSTVQRYQAASSHHTL